jgi:glycerol-3-phosphate cytidylyltransferase
MIYAKKLPLLTEIINLLVHQNKQSLDLNFKELFKKNYTTVLTYGTFDLLHFGHLEILRRAKDLGDRLIVGLSTDEFNLGKGKVCEFSYEKRKQFLESLSYVDMVIPECNWEQKTSDVIANDVDVFVMGSDWEGEFDFLNNYCNVRYFPRTKGVSTTELKKIIKKS